MPLVAAAVCPNPPLLVPELAAGAAGELDDLRAACDAAVAELCSAEPELLAVVGAGPETRELPPPYRGSFAPWGARTEVSVGADGSAGARPGPGLPLGPLIGAWLLARQERIPQVRMWSVSPRGDAASCARLGAEIAALGRVGMLVLGDGSACHGERSPGYADPRAEPFDAAVVDALAEVDTRRLLALDPGLADRLLVSGRAPWQVLAGATTSVAPATDAAAAGRRWRALLRYAAAPYGVGYFVASWS